MPVPPPQPPANVRMVEVSRRGKRDYNYSWPTVDYEQMRAAYRRWKPVYRNYWESHAPGGQYALTFSAFVAQALLVAFEDVEAWLPTIRNDARKEPIEGGRQQVPLVWPVEVERRVVDMLDTFDLDRLPPGFALTKQHLTAAAILHGLRSVEQWVLSCRNDDRYSVPVAEDRRLRHNRGRADGAETSASKS